VGETTRYVINKATCRVILTAPPAAPALDPMGPQPSEPPLPLGHALGVSDDDAGR
jgi:hypothetical protein